MDSGVLLVILVLVGLVVGVNGALYLSLRRGGGGQHFKLWRNAASRARNPWQQEEDNLEALSKLVSELQKRDQEDQDS
jgi:hypothetical protein